jgi:hypothetical protein
MLNDANKTNMEKMSPQMVISETDRASYMTEKQNTRIVPHLAPSLNFKRNVILVSDEREYEPEHIL